MSSLADTLGNPQWMAENAEAIKKILPEAWTEILKLNGLQLGYQMKLIGIDWRSQDEFGKVMVYLERVGLMQRDGLRVRRAN